ncbi:cation:proton antiporter [soil metagenome]
MENSYPFFFEFDFYIVQMLILACVVLIILILTPLLKPFKYITSAIFFLLVGMVLAFLPIPWELPPLSNEPLIIKRITELGVIIALASVGLKINDPFKWKTWRISTRLLIITMPLSIFLTAYLGWYVMGLVPASALLLGAVIAPTDPVLADDVQTSDPGDSDSSSTRLALTTEAGLNDGLAFPFTNLAIAVAIVGLAPSGWFLDWLIIDVFYKIIVGAMVGFISGKVLAFLLFKMPKKDTIKIADGVFAVALALFPYSLAELLSSYGFISVFIAACIFRQHQSEHDYQKRVHQFSITMEQLFEGILMLMIGGYIVFGVLEPLTLPMIVTALIIIFIVRPVCGIIAFIGSKIDWPTQLVISFFGIRGIGSLYYLAFGIYMADFPQADELWAITILIITVSVFIHGFSAKYVMDAIDHRENKNVT